MTGLFSMTYLGPIAWYARLLSCDAIFLEACESWQKQSYRNRCYIDSPNGALMLNIPVQHTGGKQHSGDVKVSLRENWPARHWQAIKTTYNSSPFFEVLGPELEPYYHKPINNLWDWNLQLLKLMLNWLQVELTIKTTKHWEVQPGGKQDFRESFHPKHPTLNFPSYPQVFDTKFGFRSNLSIIDLMFNEGPAAYDYLKQL